MNKTALVFITLCICSSIIYAQSHDLLQNVYNRTSISLNGDWKYIVGPYENGYYNYRLILISGQ